MAAEISGYGIADFHGKRRKVVQLLVIAGWVDSRSSWRAVIGDGYLVD